MSIKEFIVYVLVLIMVACGSPDEESGIDIDIINTQGQGNAESSREDSCLQSFDSCIRSVETCQEELDLCLLGEG